MAVTGLKVTTHAGALKVLRFTVTDSDAGGDFDLTAAGLIPRFATALFAAGTTNPVTSQPLVEKTVGSGITLNPSGLGTNIADVQIDTADFLNSDIGDRFFEFDVKDASGEVVVLASGTLTILPNIENT